ncbi:Pumilio RNA-binding repeat [Dillenia turbinata]|uniref:Pumilio RNA-binding repeat n=1 Tax=Dillenia turbinata TaxID=194707 RepID=A0AAN8YXC8_9MAGN
MEKQNQETILPQETPQRLVPSAQENHHPNLFITENNGSQPNPPLNLPRRSRPLNFPSRLIDSFDSLNLSNHNSSVFGGQVLPGSSSNPVLSPCSPINFPSFEMGFDPNPNQSDLDLLEKINGGYQYPHCLAQAEAEEIIREEEINGGFQYSYDLVLAEAERIQRNLQRLRTEFRLSFWNSNLAPDLDSNTNSRPRRSRRSRNLFNATSSCQPMFLNSEPNNSNYLDSSNFNLLNSAPNLIAGLKAALSPLSLEQLKGKLNFLARNQTGSKFLQAKLEAGKREDIDLIFTELKFFVQELLTDQVGNHVMQKLFAACNEKQMNFILFELFNAPGGLLNICCKSRCVQKFIEHLTSPSLKATLVKFLKPITCSTHGRCVIEFCLRIFSHEDVKI